MQGIQLFLQSVQDVRMGGRLARTQYQYTLQDANLDELRSGAPRMVAALRKLPELKDVNTDQQTAGLELDVDVDRDTAARLGVTMRDVDNTLYDAFGQRQVATTYTQLNQYRVVLEIMPELGQDPERDQLALRDVGDGRPGAAVGARQAARRTRCRCRSTTRGSFRR